MRTKGRGSSNRVLLAHIFHLPLGRLLTHALNARMLKSVMLSFSQSRSFHRPPQDQSADAVEDGYSHPARPRKGLLTWSFPLITEADEE